MIFVLGWISSGVIGYLLGNGKGNGTSGFFLGLLFGPIGWLITAVSSGDRVVCRFCREKIHKEATVCPKCQREQAPVAAPAAPAAADPGPPAPELRRAVVREDAIDVDWSRVGAPKR